VLDLLSKVIDPKMVDQLKARWGGKPEMTPEDFAGTGINVAYDPKRLELVAIIPGSMRASRMVSVSSLDQMKIGTFAKPATFDAYMNGRGSLNYIGAGSDRGLQDPIFALDGAMRIKGLVLESEAVAQPGLPNDFQRQGTRLVY